MNEKVTVGAAESRARSGMYRFFSNVFLRPPDEALMQKLPELLILDDLGSLFDLDTTKVLQSYLSELDQEKLARLRQEYFDLFVVPTKRYVAPFEDVYRESTAGAKFDKGPLMGTRAISVIRAYRAAGATMNSDCKEVPTHVGVELAFMSFLCEKETEAWCGQREAIDAGDDPQMGMEVNRYRDLQRVFLQEHLAVWLPNLRSAIEANALTPYFSSMTGMGAQYVALDLEGMSTSNDMLETVTPQMVHG